MKKIALVFLLYSIIAIIYTFPLVFQMDRATYGYPGDNFGTIHYFWWWQKTALNNLPLRDSFLEQAPFGYHLDSEPGFVFYFWPLKILTLAFGSLVAYNLVLFLSFPLTALSLFLLTRSIFGRVGVAFWAGLVFGFSPYHFWKAYNHLDLSLLWWLPLSLLFVLKFLAGLAQDKFERRSFVGAVFFTVATILTNLYYGYFLVLSLSLLFAFTGLVRRLPLGRLALGFFAWAFLSASIALPFLWPTVKDALLEKGVGQSLARQASYRRPILDVVSLSARPWDYFLPSPDNPWLGGLSEKFHSWVRRQGGDFKVISGPVHERTIFLGFVSIALLLTSYFLLLKSQEFRRQHGRFSITLLLITFSLFVISMPPYIFIKGQTFYLPSFFLYQIFPLFRTYSRLGVFVQLFAVLLAAGTLTFLLRNLSRKKLLTSYFLLLTFSVLEFANVPPGKVLDLTLPPAFDYLAKQPGNFTYVVYPKQFNVADLLVFQPRLQKGFLNFHSQSEYYALWDYLENFYDPKVPPLLSALGVKYAVFQKKPIFDQPNPVDDLWYTRALRDPLGTLPPGFTLSQSFEDSEIYEMTAEPLGLVVLASDKVWSFPRASIKVSEPKIRVYLINVSGDENRNTFRFRLFGEDGRVLALKGVSGENVSVSGEVDEGWPVTLKSDRGFLDLELGSVSSSVYLEAFR